jgi:hypothetical protein
MKHQIETETLPFPSHVKEACPNKDVQSLSRELVDTARDKNNVLACAGNVHLFVRDHYVDTSTGTYGIESLIASILRDNNAVFPLGIEGTEFRKVAIATAMFATEVIEAVRNTFGVDRYPDATIRSYLSHFMAERIGKIALTTTEDCDRKSCKPRTKFYLVEGK